ncbi:hypothetical protein EGY22_12820 [Alcaligenes faecalis]|nr:hypothetical protein EGY22_12820 [Alcaligenes faecalis]QQC34491.1 single-stranded DNA-binding protein [Alcaligenes faecalis]
MHLNWRLAWTRKWTGQDNQERYTTEIIAEQMQMLYRETEGQ